MQVVAVKATVDVSGSMQVKCVQLLHKIIERKKS
jgi:hypothetical protein